MTSTFGGRGSGAVPVHIATEPQKSQATNPISGGLEHRPFNDDEIKQAFDTFDLDKNRFVGAGEIAHLLQQIGEDVTDEEVDEMIRLCDNDGDGQVTFDEFYKLMAAPPPAPQAPKPPPQAARTKRNRQARMKQLENAGLSDPSMNMPASSSAPPAKAAAEVRQGSKKGPTAAEKKATEQQFRAMSVESLVKRLSGGIAKIKPSQIKKVYKRFRDIDKDGSGSIDYMEFCKALEIEDNPVSLKMFRVFDMDGSGAIDLKEFIVVLSRYTSAARGEKLKFAFMMFDEDGSGFIERNELLDMLGASFIVEGLSPEELDDKADHIFEFLNLDLDGAISYDQFLKLAKAKQGMIYPVEERSYALGKDESINKYLAG